MRARTLRLSKETLTGLDAGQLAAVAGGATTLPCIGIDWAYTWSPDCWNDISFERCPTPTLPIEDCI